MSGQTTTDVESERNENTNTEEPLLRVRNLKTYYNSEAILGGKPVKAVDGVSFDINQGETLGLVGESGCGKTTLGRTLVQLETPTSGEIRYEGTDITTLSKKELKKWRSNVQMVLQDPDSSLNDRMTIGEIIREPLDVHSRGTPDERRRRVRELLEIVGLNEEHYFRYPHQFSGGQRQRIGIARALALEPDFIVLDEPVSALDASVQAKILNLLVELQDEFGLTYLFIAHDLSVVRHLCDRVAVMYLGNIMEFSETEELFLDPANPYTRSLLSAIPDPNPNSDKERITLRGSPPSPRYPPSGCPFSTRCPMKIKPENYPNIDHELWDAIEAFREVLRERNRADRSVTERLRETIGLETRFADIDEINQELFDDIEIPPEIGQEIDEAMNYVRNNDEAEAIEHMMESFGSVCDIEQPNYHRINEESHTSHCHRHLDQYQEPEVLKDVVNSD